MRLHSKSPRLFQLRGRLPNAGNRRPGAHAAKGRPSHDRNGHETGPGLENSRENRRHARRQRTAQTKLKK